MGILWIVSGTARFSQCLFVGHAGLSATHHWIFPKQHIKAFSFYVFFFTCVHILLRLDGLFANVCVVGAALLA